MPDGILTAVFESAFYKAVQSIYKGFVGASAFAPASLFTGGYVGGWYDPSDLSTMFTTSKGETQVTADGDPVGLILDKSQGLALGDEYITVAADRDFSSDTGYWAKDASATITGGVVNVSTASDIYPIYKFNQFLNGGYYEITYTLTVVSGGCGYWINGRNGAVKTVSGTYTDRIFTTPIATLGFRTGGAFVGTIDNVSVKPILGNHLTQATAGFRPQYKTSGGLHWLEFDTVDDFMAGSESLDSVDDMYFSIVGEKIGGSGGLFLLGSASTNRCGFFNITTSGRFSAYFRHNANVLSAVTSASNAWADATDTVVDVYVGIGTSNIWSNGVEVTTNTNTRATEVITGKLGISGIGVSNATAVKKMYGAICLFADPATNRSNVHTWLVAKSGLTV